MGIKFVKLAALGILTLAIGFATSAAAEFRQSPPPGSLAQEPVAPELQHCIDALFHFLPGYTENCIGAREWRHGDYDDALSDLKDAAGWASKNAQYSLGLIYFNGHHTTADRPLGLAWLLLAAERKSPQHYVDVAVAAYRMVSPAERRRAIQLLNSMSLRYADAYAARRAMKHFDHAMRSSVRRWGDGSGTSLCIAGLTPMGDPGNSGAPGGRRGENHPTEGTCPPTSFVVHSLNHAASVYFKDALPEGHVDVGPLEQVIGPGGGPDH